MNKERVKTLVGVARFGRGWWLGVCLLVFAGLEARAAAVETTLDLAVGGSQAVGDVQYNTVGAVTTVTATASANDDQLSVVGADSVVNTVNVNSTEPDSNLDTLLLNGATSGSGTLTVTLDDGAGNGFLLVNSITIDASCDFTGGDGLVLNIGANNAGAAISGGIGIVNGLVGDSKVTINLNHSAATIGGGVDLSGSDDRVFFNALTANISDNGVVIGGNYVGSSGADNLSFAASAEITGLVNLGAGDNTLTISNNETLTLTGGLTSTKLLGTNTNGSAELSIGSGAKFDVDDFEVDLNSVDCTYNFTGDGGVEIDDIDLTNTQAMKYLTLDIKTTGTNTIGWTDDLNAPDVLKLTIAEDTTVNAGDTTSSVAALTVNGGTTTFNNATAGTQTLTAVSLGETLKLEDTGVTGGKFIINSLDTLNTGAQRLEVNADTTIYTLTIDAAAAGNQTVTIGGSGKTVISWLSVNDASDKLIATGSGDFTLTTTADLTNEVTFNSTGTNAINLTSQTHTGTFTLNEDTTINSGTGSNTLNSVRLASGKTLTTGGDQDLNITLDTLSGGNLELGGTGSIEVTTEQNLNVVSVKAGASSVDLIDGSAAGITINRYDVIEDNTAACLSGSKATEITEVNIGGAGVANMASFAIQNVMETSHIGTINLLDTDDASEAMLNICTDTTLIDTLNVGEGKFGALLHQGMATFGTITATNVDGTLMCNNWTMGATEAINVGKTGTLDFDTQVATLTTVSGAKVNLDLGDSSDTTVFAKVKGQIVTSDADNAGDTVSEVYGVNGVSGETYANVFTAAIQAADGSTFGDDKVLSTEDAYRTYTLSNNGLSIVVSGTPSGGGSSVIHAEVTGHGGSAAAGKAADYMLDHQGEFDTAGSNYVAELTTLSGDKIARAVEQTIGDGATEHTTMTSLTTITAAAGTVENQMINFRSGNIAQGMASSFGSGGATAAMSDMPDAETLEAAYESGFTAGADTTEYKKMTVWANSFGGFGQQGTIGSDIGYDFWNVGTMVGMDYAVARELRLGALVGYSFNMTNVNWGGGDSRDNALRLGAYSSFNWDNFFFDFSPTMGIHMIDSNRNIWNGTTARGYRTGMDFNANGMIGYNFDLPFAINLTPTYGLNYTLFYDPEYTETGAGPANVTYQSFTSNSLVQDVGLKAGKLVRVSEKLAFLPEVWGGWEYEYLDTGGNRDTVTAAALGAQSYSTEMNAMARNRAYWGLGITALIKDNVSVYGRYDQRVWHKGFNVNFLVGVKVDF